MRKAECGKEGRWGPGEKGGKKEVGKMRGWGKKQEWGMGRC